MPRSFPRTRPGKKIDFKQWSSIPGLILSSAAGGLLQGGSLAFLAPATILRCRGYVQAMFDETAQPGDQAVLTYGLGIVSSDAFAAGAASMPDPAGEPEYPWLWWGEIFLESRWATGAGNPQPAGWGPDRMRLDVDTKAMRKVKPGESLMWAIEVVSVAGGPQIEHRIGQTRVLIGT